jgi:ubiquinone/menaquinone biosynthesis C-methylase UbiE
MINRLRQKLDAWNAPDAFARYEVEIWRHALMYREMPREMRCDASGALPYLPVEPESLGLLLTENDYVLDIGCLGGYGAFDVVQQRLENAMPVPRMVCVDNAEASLGLGRHMAEIWSSDSFPHFVRADAAKLPFSRGSFRLIIARLLLPYTSIDDALGEMSRVVADNGLIVLQIHGPGYYLNRLAASFPKILIMQYYLRPILSCLYMRLTGRQSGLKWFTETALTTEMLYRCTSSLGFVLLWQNSDALRPMAVFRSGTFLPRTDFSLDSSGAGEQRQRS